jgi:hypothetical protein
MKQSSTYSREMQTGVHLDTRSQCLTEMATFMERHSTGGPDPLLRERYSCFSLPAEVGAETVLFNFQCPGSPDTAVLLDNAGNLYGTTADTCDDDHDQGSVYQLTKVGNTWSANSLRIFQGGSDGSGPTAALVSDSSGNLYGSTTGGGLGRSGTLFEFSRAGNGWNYSQIYGNFIGSGGLGQPLLWTPPETCMAPHRETVFINTVLFSS